MTGPAAVRSIRAGWSLVAADEPPTASLSLGVTGSVLATDAGPGDGVDLGDERCWAMPALADAHDHGRGLPTLAFAAQDEALELWISALSLQPRIDPWLLTAFALAKLARSGVAGVVHCHNTQDPDALVEECLAAARAAGAVGVRLGLAVPLADRNRLGYGPDDAILALLPENRRAAVADRWCSPAPSVAAQLDAIDAVAEGVASAGLDDLVAVQYCPVGPQWCSDELLAGVAAESARTGRRIHTHLFETRLQREWADAAYPTGLLHHLDALGLISDRLTVAHGVWLDDTELALLAERRVVVSVNATSNLRLRSGTARLSRMLELGVAVAMGLDGMSLDDDEDALREARLLHLLHHGEGLAAHVGAGDVLRAATTTGPVAVAGRGAWGRLEPGAPADVVLLDGDALGADLVPGAGHDLATLVLARARAQHVRHLVVAGREVVRDGVVLGVDEEAIAAEVTAISRSFSAADATTTAAVAALQGALRQFYGNGGHRRVATDVTGRWS